MKGLALNVVWGLIIGIVSLLVFLSLVTGTFKNTANWFYCDIYIKVINFFSGSGMASIPDQCKDVARTHVKKAIVDDEDNKIFSRKLLSYIIACWNEAELKGLYESHPCYELQLSGNVEDVSEYNVTNILIKEDQCKSIENSDYNEIFEFNCGEKNQIIWFVEVEIDSLTKKNISDAINEVTVPGPIPVEESMIPSVDDIKTTMQLKNFLADDVPDSICNSLGEKCSHWKYGESTGYVSFRIILDTDTRKTYIYDVAMVIHYLKTEGIIKSVINDQKILLIEYNGIRDAVEVVG